MTRIPRWEHSENALRVIDETCQMFVDAKDSLQPPNATVCIHFFWLSALRIYLYHLQSSLLKHQSQAHYAFKKSRSSTERTLSGSRAESLGVSLSPSDTHFPFEFSESPPQMMSITAHMNRVPGASPVDSDDTVPANGEHMLFGEKNQWGQYLAEMGVGY